MTEALDMIVTTPEQSHRAAVAAHALCKRLTLEGKKARILAAEEEDDRTLQQNKFYWGIVLKQISEQAQDGGIGAQQVGWHRYYKIKFLGYKITRVRMPGKKRPSILRELRSTKELKVKPFSDYLEKVIAHAVTTFDVRFTETRWENHR